MMTCDADNQSANTTSPFSTRDRDPSSDPPLVGGLEPGLAGQASPASLGVHPVIVGEHAFAKAPEHQVDIASASASRIKQFKHEAEDVNWLPASFYFYPLIVRRIIGRARLRA